MMPIACPAPPGSSEEVEGGIGVLAHCCNAQDVLVEHTAPFVAGLDHRCQDEVATEVLVGGGVGANTIGPAIHGE